MAYTITPSADGKYILIKVTGEVTRKVALEYILKSHALGRELGINCYLVDGTEARNVESNFGNYNFAYYDAPNTPNIDKSARVALLVSPDDRSHDFVEIVSQNANFYVKLFTDREKAVAYLLEGKS